LGGFLYFQVSQKISSNEKVLGMATGRITTLSALLFGTAMIVWSAPSQAGFEFTPPPAAVKAAAPPATSIDDMASPMPIVPVEPVAGMPLDGGPADDSGVAASAPLPQTQPVKPAASSTASNVEPVYIRRQRTVVVKPSQNEPMDTEALLRATENSEPVSLVEAPRVNQASQASQDVAAQSALVINPYPLEEQGAVHGGDLGPLSVEQAMMEETGNLRAVAVPGKGNPAGMIARAKISSRYDTESQYLARPAGGASSGQSSMNMFSSMTPIPGGEGTPLNRVESAPLAPMPSARPQVEASVKPTPLAPMPAAAMKPVPRTPVVAARSSTMPTPATPQNYPAPLVPAASPAVPQATQAPQQIVAANTTATATSGYDEAVGFGRDLPLPLALSQIVPPEYTYAFGQNVNVGANVSWQGGKPWNEVLNQMLAKNGMIAVIEANQVTIRNAGGQTPASSAVNPAHS
jgi:hypothetical protein